MLVLLASASVVRTTGIQDVKRLWGFAPDFTLERAVKAQKGSIGIDLIFLFFFSTLDEGGQWYSSTVLPPGERAGHFYKNIGVLYIGNTENA